ncbi:hypothetical protein N566_16055 [Streptomycetaceae bacterium MP113-05]|nr:hypothetical protein N566_16055 [Streptomycetaceae bacterium MP113-05]
MDALRLALVGSPDLFCFFGGTLEEGTAITAEADGVPRGFVDFCRVLDGVSCSTSLQLFGLEQAQNHQSFCQPVVGSLLPLSPEKLYCIGMINDTPVYLDRADGGVLATPERQGEWAEADSLEQLADGLEAFFLEQVATSEYVLLARIDDEMSKFDDWPKLLRRAGLTG